jgi:amino acid transporter
MEASNMQVKSFFQPRKIPAGIYPLLMVMSFAVCGASYFAYHSAVGPEIGWDKKKTTPNYFIQPHQTSKFWNPTGSFTEYWRR